LGAEFRISGIPATMMNAIARIQDKGQITIPMRVRKQAGLSKGDVVEFSYRQGKILMTPKAVIDRSKFPVADEYTPEERREIDARLDAAERGESYGPFKSAREIAVFLEKWKREHKTKRTYRAK
jgi:AbrB family looped-hinge helix DNA binding protein